MQRKTLEKKEESHDVFNNTCNVESLFKQYHDAINKDTDSKIKSNKLLDFVVIFLTQSKPEKAEEINNKYNYLVPETFLCWALFEYSYYNRRSEASESVAQFVMKTLENKTLDSAYVFNSTTGHHNEYSKFIELHYEAYKYLAGDKKNDIYEHLKELLTRCDRGT